MDVIRLFGAHLYLRALFAYPSDVNHVQSQGGYENLNISLLESKINETGWLKAHIYEQVTSTNDVVLENLTEVVTGQGIVAIANEQTRGRGRLDRKWSAPAGSGIAMSIGIKVQDFPSQLSAIPLMCGLAVIRTLEKFSIPVALKWPNDIVFTTANSKRQEETSNELRKVGGILVQLVQDNLIIGIGLNVSLKDEDLPVAHATSLLLEGYEVDRHELISKLLEEINFLRTENFAWLEDYKNFCVTIGKNISVKGVSGETITGKAVDVLSTGALVIKNLENLYQITIGDVEHLEVNRD